MKRLALVVLATTALSSAAFAADMGGVIETSMPGVSGDVTLYGGGANVLDYYDDYEFGAALFGGAGRVNVWLTPEMSAQFDISGEFVFDEEDDYSLINLATHVNWRSDGYLLGAFGSLSGESNWWEAVFVAGGIEGQAWVGGDLLLSGQAGYIASIEEFDEDDTQVAYVRGEVKYFLTPNMAVSGNIGAYHQTYAEGDDLIEGLTWGAEAEYRFDDTPFSVFAGYQGTYESEADEDEDWASHAILVGLRVNFGDETLKGQAATGATLRDYNPITGYRHSLYNDLE